MGADSSLSLMFMCVVAEFHSLSLWGCCVRQVGGKGREQGHDWPYCIVWSAAQWFLFISSLWCFYYYPTARAPHLDADAFIFSCALLLSNLTWGDAVTSAAQCVSLAHTQKHVKFISHPSSYMIGENTSFSCWTHLARIILVFYELAQRCPTEIFALPGADSSSSSAISDILLVWLTEGFRPFTTVRPSTAQLIQIWL